MSSETLKMCIINDRFRHLLSQYRKLIVRNSRFHEFCTVKLCVVTYVYETGFMTIGLRQLLGQGH